MNNQPPPECFLCEEEINDPYVHYGKNNKPTCLKCCEDHNEIVEIGITLDQYSALEDYSSLTPFEIGKLITKGVAAIRVLIKKAQDEKNPSIDIPMTRDVEQFMKNGGYYKKISVEIPRSYKTIINQLASWMPCIQLKSESASDWVTMVALGQTINSIKPQGGKEQ